MKLTKQQVIEINKKLGKEFNTAFGMLGNASNLDYAMSLKEPYSIAMEIVRGHPFVD